MRVGNASWGFRETSIKEQFEITRNMGLDILEIGIANAETQGEVTIDITDEQIKEILSMTERYGVDILCAATGNDFTTGIDDIPKIKKVIDICKKLGVKYLRIFTGFTPLCDITDKIFETMIKALCEVCDYAKENNVVPVIETHGAVNGYDDGVEHIMSTTTDLDTFKKILSMLPDNVKVCFDPANLYAVGIREPEKVYNELKDKIAYAHFKDFSSLPSGHLKPSFCGDSDMNWKAILETMKDFNGFTVLEYENIEDIKDGLEKSLNYIKGVNINE